MSSNTVSSNQKPLNIKAMYMEREALLKYLKIKDEFKHELVNVGVIDGIHFFKKDEYLFEVYSSVNRERANKAKELAGGLTGRERGSVVYTFNSNLWSISPVTDQHLGMIDTQGLYEVTLGSGTVSRVDGKCLFHNYLCNKLNRKNVMSYSRIPGVWYDVYFDEKKQWAVYAVSESVAILKRFDDLQCLGRDDMERLSAMKSIKNEHYEQIV